MARQCLRVEAVHRRVQVLIGTDVASRGLDIKGVERVINYDLPSTIDDYVRRAGRAAYGGWFRAATLPSVRFGVWISELVRSRSGRVEASWVEIPAVSSASRRVLPRPPQVHRIGRTGRIGHQGYAISFFHMPSPGQSNDAGLAPDLVQTLCGSGQEVRSACSREGCERRRSGQQTANSP